MLTVLRLQPYVTVMTGMWTVRDGRDVCTVKVMDAKVIAIIIAKVIAIITPSISSYYCY